MQLMQKMFTNTHGRINVLITHQFKSAVKQKRHGASPFSAAHDRFHYHSQGQRADGGDNLNEGSGAGGSGSYWGLAAGAGTFIFGLFLGNESFKYFEVSAASPKPKMGATLAKEKELRIISNDEVAKHYNLETGIWVTYKGGVYDVTEFVPQHPGGSRILMAAGSQLEPFWELYQIHQTPEVLHTLEKYKIGTLSEKDKLAAADMNSGSLDAFANDPKRHVSLIPRSLKPFNGETHPSLLTGNFFTPNELFYVRNHLPVPHVEEDGFGLEIGGLKLKERTLTLADIKKLPKVHINSTIQCAGNRRADMNKYKPVSGLGWTGGAIGNARWSGARLIDVLDLIGFSKDNYTDVRNKHIQFEGLDSDPSGESYGASIPLSYIFDGNFEAVVAYEMNGKTLPLDHGYPLRIILPGVAGARNVKWLTRITISDEESQSLWQQRDYKVFSPSVNLSTVEYNSSPPIIDMPINSYICSHEDGSVLPKGTHKINGYAYSGGGRGVTRVEVSVDQGKTWEVAQNVHSDKNGNSSWSWLLWEKELTFSQAGETEIWVKSVDSSYNQQVESYVGTWNFRGLLPFAYHKIKCTIK